MSQFKTLDDLDVAGKRVVVRLDLNVPMKDGRVTDATRIERSLATVRELSEKKAKVIVLAHFGRPKGEHKPEMTLAPVADAMQEMFGAPVGFAGDCVGELAARAAANLDEGGVVLLENVRFHPGEETNDPGFARQLAALGDIYVNDAFSCSHRAHASTEGISHLLPSAAGRLMQQELEALQNALENPEHPVAAVVGGAKVSTKMEVLGNLIAKVDVVIIGGGMANTFLAAQGIDVGKSLCEHEMADDARAIMQAAEAKGCEIALPIDAVVAAAFEENAPSKTVGLDAIPSDMMILDVGPSSVARLIGRLQSTKTLLWNGPMGAFEIKPFDAGTNALAQAAADLTKQGQLLSVAGGGDTVAALEAAGVADDFSYVSTAGGAFLEWLEGKTLPGVAALEKAA